MRVIIAGPSTFHDYDFLCRMIEESGFDITTVICGMAAGADSLGLRWAMERNISVEKYPAQWSKYGKSAGRIRNAEMAEVADALVCPTTGSPGTKNMISLAKAKGLLVFERPYKPVT